MIKRSSIWIMLIAALCIILTGCNEQKKNTQTPNTVKATSSDSAIVAQVENTTITASQFLSRVQNEKQAFESIKKPQSEEFYKKVTLGLMVQEILLTNEAQKQGIFVSREETADYLNQQRETMQSLGDNNQEKITYLEKIRAKGFNTPSDYTKSSEVISDTQKSLIIVKLINKTGPKITETLLNQKDYKIYIPIDISGFQKDMDNVLGKTSDIYKKGIDAFNAQDFKEAHLLLKQVKQEDVNYIDAQAKLKEAGINLANIYLNNGKTQLESKNFDSAIEFFTAALEYNSELTEARTLLTQAQEKTGQK